MRRLKEHFSFIKTTLLGGILFLLPVVLLVTFLGKAIQIIMDVLQPIDEFLGIDTIGGIAFLNFISFVVLIFICFIAGIIAQSKPGRKFFQAIEQKLLNIPGYAVLKARVTGNLQYSSTERSMKPVLAKIGTRQQIGFEVSRLASGKIAVFLPKSPDPWSGTLVFINEEEIEPINASIRDTLQIFESLGIDAERILNASKES